MTVHGQVLVVLGGTSGVGAEVVRRSLGEGARVVFQGRDATRSAKILALGKGSKDLVFASGDIYNYDDTRRIIRTAIASFGRVDALVASGGSFEPRPKRFGEITPEEMISYFESRLYHRLYAIHAAFELMKEQGSGAIVALTTDAGRIPTPAESVIGGAAAALIYMTAALAKEFSPHGVRLNTVSLSLTKGTPSYEAQRERLGGDTDADDPLTRAFAKLEERAPFGLCDPSDIANMVLFLCSPLSNKLSGAVISVNGGASYPRY